MRRTAFSLGCALVSCAMASAAAGEGSERRTDLPRVWFNQHAIESARADFPAEDPIAVFRLVFSQLDDEVVVYPTENYYYFQFQARGRTYWGNLRLSVLDRERGVINLGYFEFDDNGQRRDMTGKGRAFSLADGVLVTPVDPWQYDVRFAGRTVRFRLNDPGFAAPQRARLRPREVYVGPILDESGLPFHLVFDGGNRRFLYVLDEDHEVPETFLPYDERVVVGRRTGFAFFADAKYERKVLVAVHASNANRNGYYDGPFDQLPDNYAERTRMKERLEAVYPFTRGQVDDFGYYLQSAGTERVAIWAYAVYTAMKELDFVAACAKVTRTEDELYPCIAPDLPAMGAVLRQPVKVGETTIQGTVHD